MRTQERALLRLGASAVVLLAAGAAFAQAARPPRWTSFVVAQTSTGVNGTSTRTTLTLLPNGRATSNDGPAPWATPAQRGRMLGLLRRAEFWAGMRDGFHCPAGSGSLTVSFTMATAEGSLTQDVSGCVTALDNNIARQVYETQP